MQFKCHLWHYDHFNISVRGKKPAKRSPAPSPSWTLNLIESHFATTSDTFSYNCAICSYFEMAPCTQSACSILNFLSLTEVPLEALGTGAGVAVVGPGHALSSVLAAVVKTRGGCVGDTHTRGDTQREQRRHTHGEETHTEKLHAEQPPYYWLPRWHHHGRIHFMDVDIETKNDWNNAYSSTYF